MTALRAFPFVLLTVAALGVGFPSEGSSQTRAEAKCRDTLAKSLTKYVGSYFRATAECHDSRSSGALPLSTDCNDRVDADTEGKVARSAEKLRAVIGGAKNKCFDSDALLEQQYPACPSPVEEVDDGGASSGIDDLPELAVCVLALTDAVMEPALDQVVGQPAAELPPQTAACQQVLADSVSKLVTTIQKERRKCQRTIDRQGVGLDYACDGLDPNGKITAALIRFNNQIDAGCNLAQSDLAQLDACADTTPELRDCAGDAGTALGSALIRSAYDLAGGGGPTTTTTTLPNDCGNSHPGCGGDCPAGTACTNEGSICRCRSSEGCAAATIVRRVRSQLGEYPIIHQTQLSTGWSGTAHQLDIPADGGSGDVVDVVCDENCENCRTKLNPVKDEPQAYCRCASDSRVACDTINGADADDCSGLDNTCHCYFGAPLAISAGGTPVCVLNRIKNDYGGTMNLRTGEYATTTNLISLVHLGLGVLEPCPVCNGDATPNDGIRDGTCAGGLTSGACDVNGTHPTFGPTSFDCLPNAATNISGNGLQINLNYTSGSQSLAFTLPCDNPALFGDCPCRVCSADGTLGCTSDADCTTAGAGTCTAGGGAGVRPNECTDRICSAQGRCDAGPVDRFCDGTTHPDGRGFATCTSDADCAAAGGTCTVSENRRCFPDPIVVRGHADPFETIVSAIFCIPPTTSAAVNASGGIPGPGTSDLEFEADLRCFSEFNEPYQLPAGANCTPASTTTTTSITLPPCDDAVPPLCVGSCGSGEGCGVVGAACACAPTTTTTMPPCGGTFPLCSGNCANGQYCLPDALTQSCLCTPLP